MTQTFPIDSTPTPSNPSSHFDTEEQENSFTITGGTVAPKTLTVDEDVVVSEVDGNQMDALLFLFKVLIALVVGLGLYFLPWLIALTRNAPCLAHA